MAGPVGSWRPVGLCLAALWALSQWLPMRRTALLLALVPACALIGACGKGGYYASTASQASSAASATTSTPGKTGQPPGKTGRPPGKTSQPPGQTGQPPTKAEALAFAHAVNLTAADVPGFTASPKQHGESASERRLEQELRRCTGAAGSQALGSRDALAEAGSPDFELKHGILSFSVSSEVSVAQSSAQAAGSLSAVRSARVRACVTRYLGQLLKAQHTGGAKVTGVSIVSGTPPAPDTTGGFGWRITAKLAYRGVPLSFYLDILGFVDGPAQVTLTSSGALRPFPAKAEEQLFSLLLARAKSSRP